MRLYFQKIVAYVILKALKYVAKRILSKHRMVVYDPEVFVLFCVLLINIEYFFIGTYAAVSHVIMQIPVLAVFCYDFSGFCVLA